MAENIFSKLVSITSGLHRDNRTENDFKFLNSELDEIDKRKDAIFKINFKRPLNDKKEYYYKLISNQFKQELKELKNEFDDEKTDPESKYNFIVFHNKYHKYLTDISDYISKRNISDDLSNDENYIINYLKIKAIQLYLELQEQYGKYSDKSKYSVSEIAEKYFDDTEFNESIFVETVASKKETVKKASILTAKTKTTFGYIKDDVDWLLRILKRLQLSIDLLDNKSQIEDLYKLLLSENFKEFKKIIYLDCKTTEFKYVVKKLQPYFKNFTPALIESTGLFITKLGKPLTAQNLYSKSKSPLKKETIDNIFKQIQ